MKPTQEQIQAGIDAFYGSNKTGPLFAVQGMVEVILEAALSASPAGVGVETPPPSTHVAGLEPVGFGCFDKGLLFATFYDRSSAEAEARMHQDTEVHPIFRHPPSTTEGQDND